MTVAASRGNLGRSGSGSVPPRPLRELGFRGWWSIGLAAALALVFLVLFRAWIFRQFGVEIGPLSVLPGIGGLFERSGFSASHFQDWGHAYIVPGIAAYYVWSRRASLRRAGFEPFWPGLLPLVLGVLVYWNFTIIGTHILQGFGILLSLAGLIMLTLGPRAFGVLFLPLSYLGFATQVSEQIMNAATWQLKLLASKGAHVGLNLIGVQTQVRGNLLTIWDPRTGDFHDLNVAEACSGMRMLVAFLALAAAVAMLSCKTWWQRTAVLLVAAPVALLMNIVRVVVLGQLTLLDPELAAGASHELIGTVLLIPAFLLFMGIVWCLNRMLVEDDKKGVGT